MPYSFVLIHWFSCRARLTNCFPSLPKWDKKSCSHVYMLYRTGILAGGDARGTFSPNSYITRQECAAIVARMAESNSRVSFTLS